MEQIINDIIKKYAIAPRSLMKKLTDLISQQGFKIDSRETTVGAIKTWMDPASKHIEKDPIKEIFPIIKKSFKAKMNETGFGDFEISGEGFEITRDGHSLVIAVYAGSRAEEYKMGLDV